MKTKLLVLLLATLVLGCNEHVFQRVIPITTRTVVTPKKVDIDRAADILFVIDNSGSMAEEQENLARNASSSSSSSPSNACNAGGFADLRAHIDAHPEQSQEEWPQNIKAVFAECGFIERLMLFKNHFHIGVITTDMFDCDNRYNSGPRLATPQRGCLQTSREDPTLKVLKWDETNLPDKFANIVLNVGIVGSAWEQGLKAAENFLTPAGIVDPKSNGPSCAAPRDCSGDLAAFLRAKEVNAAGDEVETKLVIIYLTDEEDCSNDNTIDENQAGSTDLCYTQPNLLTDPQRYVSFFRGLKGKPELVSMALIAGLYDSGSGLTPSGCKSSSGGPINTCDEARGNSVATCVHCVNGNPVCVCHPAIAAAECQGTAHPATNCCQADAAERYFRVATQMNSFKIDTLCSGSYKDTMIAIANLINETGVIVLPEVPTDPDQLVVHMRGPRWPGGEWQNVPRFNESTSEPSEGGFALIDENTRIKFFRTWVPQPGDEVQVMFLGD